MVLLLDSKEIKNHTAVTVTQHVGYTTGGVSPESKSDEVDHGLDLLIEIGRAFWTLDVRKIDLWGWLGL